MGKSNKRKHPTSERGVVLAWVRGDNNCSKGFGFVEREDGASKLFVHKAHITDGNALKVGTQIQFDARSDPKGEGFIATNVRGGVCFDHVYRTGGCPNAKRCKLSHADRMVVRAHAPAPPPPLSLESAAAAVAAARGSEQPDPVLVDTLDECTAQISRLAQSAAVAVDFEGANLCRDGELHLVQLAAESGPVVLVDIVRLGDAAFSAGGLRALLESETVIKLLFDGRADADVRALTCLRPGSHTPPALS